MKYTKAMKQQIEASFHCPIRIRPPLEDRSLLDQELVSCYWCNEFSVTFTRWKRTQHTPRPGCLFLCRDCSKRKREILYG